MLLLGGGKKAKGLNSPKAVKTAMDTTYTETKYDKRIERQNLKELVDENSYLLAKDPTGQSIKIDRPLGSGGQALVYDARLIYGKMNVDAWRGLLIPILTNIRLLGNSGNISHWHTHNQEACRDALEYNSTTMPQFVKDYFKKSKVIEPNRRVVVRVSRHMETDKDILDRELRQRKLTGLVHPNIPYHFTIGELQDGRSYTVLERLDGAISPEQTSKWSLDKQLNLFTQLVNGLKKLKEYGILHRDLKPDNLLYKQKKNQVKIADYGLMKQSYGRSTFQTEEGKLLGTAGFMSPEQVRELESCDWRSDQFSAGATMYEIITKKDLLGLPEDQRHDIQSILTATLDRPKIDSILDSKDIRKECVEMVIARMMQPEQERRYQDHDEILEDLERIKQGKFPKNTNSNYVARVFSPSQYAGSSGLLRVIRGIGSALGVAL